jgi:alpha-mannosidase
MATPQHHPTVTRERIDKALSPDYLTSSSTNLLTIRFGSRVPLTTITCHHVPGGPQERPPFASVVTHPAAGDAWDAFSVGTSSFGPTWSSHWVCLRFTVPEAWGRDDDDDGQGAAAAAAAAAGTSSCPPLLLFDSSCECLVFTADGEVVQGLTGGEGGAGRFRGNRRVELVLTPRLARPGVETRLYVEVAANGLFGADGALVGRENASQSFSLVNAELARVDVEGEALFWDFVVLRDLALRKDGGYLADRAMAVANAVLNVVERRDRRTFARARELAREVLRPCAGGGVASSSSSSRHDPVSPRVFAVGHCHIDSAWLWRYAETRRKVARSWASQIRYMVQGNEVNQPPPTLPPSCGPLSPAGPFTFAASQAYQYSAVLDHYPSLSRDLRAAISSGRFVPVGASWVEPDANLPSGESLVRQVLVGARFLKRHFGREIGKGAAAAARAAGLPVPSRVPHGDGVFWLPDTFGYAPQLPAILRGCGLRYFLTQKLSWSLVNKPAHNTFFWTALDGSSVLAHFPPADTYCAQGDVNDVLASFEGNKDRGRSATTLMLYGHGDGGGGPTPAMFQQMGRLGARPLGGQGAVQPLPGFPTLEHATPRQFFDALAEDLSRAGPAFDAVTWRGELYLELHNATLTSQAAMKRGCRRCEGALHSLEVLAATRAALARSTAAYPSAALERLWRELLLQQFHDVLPGSSVADVHKDAREAFARVETEGTALAVEAAAAVIGRVAGGGGGAGETGSAPAAVVVFNPTQFPRRLTAAVEVPGFGFAESPAAVLAAGADSSFSLVVGGAAAGLPLFAPSAPSLAALASAADAFGGAELPAPTEGGPHATLVLDTGAVRAVISRVTGHLLSLVHTASGREVIAAPAPGDGLGESTGTPSPQQGGNRMLLFDCTPFFWDAWDTFPYSLEKVDVVTGSAAAAADTDNDTAGSLLLPAPWDVRVGLVPSPVGEARVRVVYPHLGRYKGAGLESWLVQDVVFRAGSARVDFDTAVEWTGVAHKFLRVEFPCALASPAAVFETQFGLVDRPTHTNTARDVMMFEVCGHRFADLSQPDFGCALLSDGTKYGYSVRENRLRLSLLRAPKAPDPDCDMGRHRFTYAFLPHAGHVRTTDAVLRAAAELSVPLVEVNAAAAVGAMVREGLFRVQPVPASAPCGVILDTIKLAEDDADRVGTSGTEGVGGGGFAVVLRFYEALGATSGARVVLPFRAVSATRVNMLEEEAGDEGIVVGEPAAAAERGPDPLLLRHASEGVQRAFARHPQPADADVRLVGEGEALEVRLGPHQIVTVKVRVEV